MNPRIFDAIRQRVTARDAAELYGMEIKMNGRALCPWHEDHKPDLSFKGAFCHCFACNASGDAVALTAKLYGLSMSKAAAKLNADFRLSLDFTSPPPLTKSQTALHVRKKQLESERKLWGKLCDIVREADRRLNQYNWIGDEAWNNPAFVSVLQARTRADLALESMWAEVIERGSAG